MPLKTIGIVEPVTQRGVYRLRNQAKLRKRRTIELFNNLNGNHILLDTDVHEKMQLIPDLAQYFVLCGSKKERWKEHKSALKCSLCNVYLCMRKYKGLWQSCWPIGHSMRSLRASVVCSLVKRSRNSVSGETFYTSAGKGKLSVSKNVQNGLLKSRLQRQSSAKKIRG